MKVNSMQPITNNAGRRNAPTDISADHIRHNTLTKQNSYRYITSYLPEWLTVVLYAVIISFAIPYHEPWADEAQAWQLARSLSIHDLFYTYLHYEGTPGLWHLFLWILIRLHISYTAMHWICGFIALTAVSLLVFIAPFPRYLKLLFPFTYFLLFQYAVVARSYVLVPLMLFLIASLWKRNPILIALLLGLLANLALHAAVISGGLAMVYVIEQGHNGNLKNGHRRRAFLIAACLLLCFYIFALWTAWPPHNLGLSGVRGESRSYIQFGIVSLVSGMCEPWIFSVPFWIAITLCIYSRKGIFYLLPVILFAVFSGAVYANFWHVGLLTPLTLCLLWITWPTTYLTSPYEKAGSIALLFMIGTQLLWSAFAITYDHYHEYSPDRATAQFLSPLVRNGATIAVTYLDEPYNHSFDAVGILPYFDHNIYLNQTSAFWWWSDRNPTEELFLGALRLHPQIILVEIRKAQLNCAIEVNDRKVSSIINSGYTLTHTFCGTKPERLQLGEMNCHLIFQRSSYFNVLPNGLD